MERNEREYRVNDRILALSEFHGINPDVMQAVYDDIVLILKNDTVAPRVEPSEMKSGDEFESRPVFPKLILVVSSTIEAAKRRLRIMLAENASIVRRCSFIDMTLDLGDSRYQFISESEIEKTRGLTFSSIIVDELVSLTTEQNEVLLSRKR